ncbi:CBD9-like protein [Xylariaceae sp. FL1651]|nr:CBD9-like protein [Xylariaceae sp. FL1651]
MAVFSAFVRLLGLLVFSSLARATIQYCHKDELVNLCLGMATTQNASTSSTDLYVTLGYEGVATTGWMAFGIGEQMNGALMFLIIADQNKDAVLSVRTTEGHFQPRLAPDKTPIADLVAINSQTEEWQEYAFVCYACDRWLTFNPSEKSHPFIWARGLKQKFKVAAVDARIQQHDHYSLFWADMTSSGLVSGEAVGPPVLDRSRGSVGTSDFGSPSESSDSKPDPGFTLARAHGLLLGLAFMVLFPLGAIVLVTGYGKAFKAHLVLQLTATLASFSGVALIAWPILANGGLERFLRSHPLFGMILMVLLAVQVWLGWWHHKNFVRLQKKTLPTFVHRWNGRFLIFLGSINAAVGIVFAKERAAAKLVWGVLAAIEAILFLIVAPELLRSKEQLYTAPAEQHSIDERGYLMKTLDSEE